MKRKIVLEIRQAIITIIVSLMVCLVALGCMSVMLYCGGYILLSIVCGLLLLGFGGFEILWLIVKIKKVKELGA